MPNNLIYDKACLSTLFAKKMLKLTEIQKMMEELRKDEAHARETFINSVPDDLREIAKPIINGLIEQGVFFATAFQNNHDREEYCLSLPLQGSFMFESLEKMKEKFDSLEKAWQNNVTIKITKRRRKRPRIS